MPMTPSSSRRWRGFLIGSGVYLLIILFFSSDAYFSKFRGGSVSFREGITFYSERWLAWAILTPFIVFLARRIRLSRSRWPTALAIHIMGGVVFTLLQNLAFMGLRYFNIIIGIQSSFLVGSFLENYLKSYQFNVPTYVIIVGLVIAMDYYRRNRVHELMTAQLETRLAGAELQALRMQVHPHFLFNTLHAISALVHLNPDAADRMINRLSEMFRLNLENAGFQEIPLESELETLDPYLEIMDMRFGDRLRVILDFPEETRRALVPNLILQPLLENAIRHGIAPKPEGGTVTVRGLRKGDRLHIEVADDGLGFQGESTALLRNGLGLSNTKERLALLYGENHAFDIRRGEEGGALVALDIPYRPAEKPDVSKK
jgi:two-component system LytT family sensor kinase